MFNLVVSIPFCCVYLNNKSVDVVDPLANKSSYTLYPIPLSASIEKFGPFNGGQNCSLVPSKVTVSIIGFDCNLDIHTNWFVCISVGTGSYNFKIRDSWLPVQVVITLLFPSPKCNRCVRYLDESSRTSIDLNWFLKASAILLIATVLGINNLLFINLINTDSALPTTSDFPLVLYGISFNSNEIYSPSCAGGVSYNPNRVSIFKLCLPFECNCM